MTDLPAPQFLHEPPQTAPDRFMRVIVIGAVVVAAASLCLEHGFDEPPIRVGVLLACQLAAVLVITADWVRRVVTAKSSAARLRPLIGLAAMIAGALVLLGIYEFAQFGVLRAAAASVLAVKAVVVLRLGMFLSPLIAMTPVRGLGPARLMVLSFTALILIGGILLSLPKAMTPEHRHEEGVYEAKRVLNCFFTATSATCVTGLVVYDTGTDFSRFGQAVILGLIQAGGLGIMIFGSVFGLLIGRNLSLKQSLLLQDAMVHQTVGELRRMVVFIVVATFCMEAVGAALVYPMSAEQAGPGGDRVFYCVFHAVSAFCNAGFALHGDSLISHAGSWPVYAAIMPLIVLGGLGFPVLRELFDRAVATVRARTTPVAAGGSDDPVFMPPNRKRRRLSLHTKLVLTTSAFLIVVPAVLLFLFESWPDWRTRDQIERAALRAGIEGDARPMIDSSPGQRAAAALFQSVTARTAGFNTVPLDVDSMSPASHFLLCLLMFVGGSPASTAGGVKTVAVAVLLLGVHSTLRGRNRVECLGRTIPNIAVQRASVLIIVMFSVASAATLSLCYTESASLRQILFEVVSACGTVGLTTGLTDKLTVAGRMIIIAAMFAGRLGPLTLLVALAGREETARYDYPAEAPIIG